MNDGNDYQAPPFFIVVASNRCLRWLARPQCHGGGLPLTAVVAAATGTAVMFLVLLLAIGAGAHLGRGTPGIVTRFMGLIVASMDMQLVLTGLKALFE